MILFTLFIALFLMCCAVVIDVGYWWVAGKRAQIAADACALAAAQSIPATNPSSGQADPSLGECIIESAPDYVLVNLPDQSGTDPEPRHTGTVVEWPYMDYDGYPEPTMVEATVQLRVQTFFGRIVGLEWIDLTRRAVAERLDPPQGNMAIFSYSQSCTEGLSFNAEDVFVNGFIHSNGQFRVDTGPFWAADGTVNKPNCPSSVDSDVEFAQFGEDRPPPWGDDCAGSPCRLPRDGVFRDWPEWYTPAQFGWLNGCDYRGETIQIDNTHLKIKDQPDILLQLNPNGPGTIIPSGTYCATKSFQIGGNDHKGVLSALSPEITVDGNGQNYTPYENNVLFFTVPNKDTDLTNDGPPTNPTGVYCDHTNPMTLNGMSYKWTGVIFNPCGEIVINNNDSVVGNDDLVGTIIGYKVKINGCCFEMVGTGEGGSEVITALIE